MTVRILSLGTALLTIWSCFPGLTKAADRDHASLFQANCAACHQSEGQGIPGAFPALAGNSFVAGDIENVIRIVLNGRGGMPAFGKDLPSEDIANIISYVREAFNGTPTELAAGQVDKLRTANRLKMERED